MKEIVKYSSVKTEPVNRGIKSSTVFISTTNISSGSSSSSSGGSTEDGDTPTASGGVIWGQPFSDEVDGQLTNHGDIILKADEEYWNAEDDGSEDNENPTGEINKEYLLAESADGGTGSIFADGYVFSKGTYSDEIYATEHLYINYPEPHGTGQKVCVGKMLENQATMIDANKTEITGLKTRMSEAETKISNNATNITNLTTRVGNAETNITNNTTNITKNSEEIEKLKGQVADGIGEDAILKLISDKLDEFKLGGYGHPIVLAAGKYRRSTSVDAYFWDGVAAYSVRMPSLVNKSSFSNGLFPIDISCYDYYSDYSYTVNVYAVQVTQLMSKKTEDLTDTSYTKRSKGAHWFEARMDSQTNTTKIYIREFSQADQNNDSWNTSNWFGDDGIEAINLTLYGYITRTEKVATTSEIDDETVEVNLINDTTETSLSNEEKTPEEEVIYD